jgi:hypothetical protein
LPVDVQFILGYFKPDQPRTTVTEKNGGAVSTEMPPRKFAAFPPPPNGQFWSFRVKPSASDPQRQHQSEQEGSNQREGNNKNSEESSKLDLPLPTNAGVGEKRKEEEGGLFGESGTLLYKYNPSLFLSFYFQRLTCSWTAFSTGNCLDRLRPSPTGLEATKRMALLPFPPTLPRTLLRRPLPPIHRHQQQQLSNAVWRPSSSRACRWHRPTSGCKPVAGAGFCPPAAFPCAATRPARRRLRWPLTRANVAFST